MEQPGEICVQPYNFPLFSARFNVYSRKTLNVSDIESFKMTEDIYVYMYICIVLYNISARGHWRTYVYAHRYVYIIMWIYIYVYVCCMVHMCMHSCIYVCTLVCTQVCLCVRMPVYINVCMHLVEKTSAYELHCMDSFIQEDSLEIVV